MSTLSATQALFPREWPALPLFLDWGEHVAICTLCQYAISVDGIQASSHFRKRHRIPAHQRQRLDEYLRTHQFRSGSVMKPRPHGSLPHPALQVLPGFQCLDCLFCSTSLDLMRRHLRKTHLAGSAGLHLDLDPLYQPALLQTWTQSQESKAYWVILNSPDSSHPMLAKSMVSPSASSAMNQAFLQQVQARESRYQAAREGKELLQHTGIATYEGTRPWLERTGWMTTYQGVLRKVLKRMVQPPSSASAIHGLPFGEHEDHQLGSTAADEKYIFYLFHALDAVLDRCEETMQHTGHHILTWLKSHFPDQPSRQPFGPLGTPQSQQRYRQTWKKFIIFALRVFRLGPGLSQQVLKLQLSPQHQQELQQVWDQCSFHLTTNTTQPHGARQVSSASDTVAAALPGLSGQARKTLGPAPAYQEAATAVAPPTKTTSHSPQGKHHAQQEGYISDREKGPCQPPPMETGVHSDESASGSDSDGDYTEHISQRIDSSQDPTNHPAAGSSIIHTSDYPPPLLETLFKLCISLSLQEFRDGKPQSTVLVYYSGILGISGDGEYFLPARVYTSHLSALIYIQRLLCLEHVLPYRPYPFIQRPCRPFTDHLTPLQTLRSQSMLPGCPTPLGEFQSLRTFGKHQATLDPPSMFLHWSLNKDSVMLENLTLSMTAFRALPEYFIQEARTLCATLLLGLHPEVKLDTIQDLFTDRRPGHSFVTNPANSLHHCYFQLVQAAAGNAQHGLMCQGAWKEEAVHQYLQHQEQLLEHIAGILITAGGQMPRLKELIGVEYTNSPCTERAFYVHQAEIVYVIRHTKSKRYTGHEFHVARFLPASAGQILFLYLVYIRPFAELLFREQQGTHVQPGPGNQLLFWSCLQGQAWTTARFHRLLTTATCYAQARGDMNHQVVAFTK